MKSIIIIPARHASTRYPGKPLAKLRGVAGEEKTLIRRSWEAAMQVGGNSRVIVATDDDRIYKETKSFGGDVVMTSEQCGNGTERCADAISRLDESYDIVINLQGDAPLTPHWFVEDLIKALEDNDQIQVATPVLRCDTEALTGFMEDRENGRVGGTTAVFDRSGRALYFSKEVIPFTGKRLGQSDPIPVHHHVGVYAYRPGALDAYSGMVPGPLEITEGLEQLRFMEHGLPVHCIVVDGRGRAFWELNNPEDVPRIEAKLAALGIE
ncbi:MAG: 3-deoxy-manno-octulosonate cytidylyltransferase [Paracoccaceae bacterium]